MAKIPKIEPTGNQLTSSAPNQLLRTPPGPGAALATAGSGIESFGEKIKQAGLLAETTRAENQLSGRLDEIKRLAGSDTDMSEERRAFYDDQIDTAIAESGNHISIPENRSMFELQSQGKAEISRNYVHGTFMKKIVDQGKADLDIYLQNKRDEFIQAPSPAEKDLAISERNNKISEMTAAGFLSTADATTLTDTQDREWGKAQVEYDISTNPEVAIQMLEQKSYPDVNEEDRADLLNKAKLAATKRIKDSQTRLQQDLIKNEANLIQGVATGKMTIDNITDISAAVAQKQIRPEVGKSAIRALLKPIDKYDMKENDEAFVKLSEGIFAADNEKDMNDVLRDILNGFNSDDLSQRNMTLLIQTANKMGAQAADVNKRVELFRSNYHRVSDWAEHNKVDKTALIKSYTDGINKEMSPEEAADTAIDNGIRMADPSYRAPKDNSKTAQPVQLVPEGQMIINIKTGEQMQMIGGRWIQIQ